jgi:hypothetical protein
MKRNLFSREFVPQVLQVRKPCLVKTSSTSNNAGLTLIELLVGASVGVIVVGIALAGALANRQFFLEDLVDGDRSQTVREAVDIVGLDLMQVGQNLGTRREFPAIQVTREAVGNNSRLIVRKNSLVPLTVCEAPASASSAVTVGLRVERKNNATGVWEAFTPDLTDANINDIPDERENSANAALYTAYDASQLPGCEYDSGQDRNSNLWQDNTMERWRNYDIDNDLAGQPTSVFLFGLVTPNSTPGSQFNWGQQFRLARSSTAGAATAFANSLSAEQTLTSPSLNKTVRVRRFTLSSADTWLQPNGSVSVSKLQGLNLYVAESREYRLENNNLTLRVNGGNPVTLVRGLSRFEVTVNRNPANTAETIPQDFCWQGAQSESNLASPVPDTPTSCNQSGWSSTKGDNNSWSRMASVDVLVQVNDPTSTSQIRESADDAYGILRKSYFPRSIFSFPS